MYAEKSCRQFLRELSSKAPVPGGGGAAALVGALASALAAMVCNLTVGKEKYTGVEAEMLAVLAEADKLREELELLLERDAEAFGVLLDAYKLPKTTKEESDNRAAALREAAREAARVPLAVCAAAVKVSRLALNTLQKGNKDLASDAVLSGLFARAAVRGACYNVLINLPACCDEQWAKQVKGQLNAFLSEAEKVENQIEEAARPLFN